MQKGDLVRFVGVTPRPNVFGWIGRTIKLHIEDGLPAWIVDPPLPGGDVFFEGTNRSADSVFDFALRPIRDPGDDARDETLEWLPVPSKQKETA